MPRTRRTNPKRRRHDNARSLAPELSSCQPSSYRAPNSTTLPPSISPPFALSNTGKVHVTRSLRDADIRHVWWCKAEHAATVANAAQLNGDVLGAAFVFRASLQSTPS